MSLGRRPGSPGAGRLLALGLLAAGCSDYAVGGLEGEPEVQAELLLAPAVLDLGEGEPGAVLLGELELSNPGTVGLRLGEPAWSGSSAFSLLEELEGSELGPGEARTLTVAYTPSDLEQQAVLTLGSPDLPADDAVRATLMGEALVPRLSFDPDPVDFGGVVLGCEATEELALLNTGTAPLRVDSLVLQGSSFEVLSQPELPLSLAPGEGATVELGFAPAIHDRAEELLWAGSDDPAGARSTSVEGEGADAARIEELFRQPDGPWEEVDFVFFIDQSGSMQDNRRKLSEQSVAFMDHLGELELDWQIAVVTRSHGCANAVLSREAGHSAADFDSILQGPFDGSTEKGLYVMEQAMAETGGGGCNEGLLREEGRAALIMVSDEPDQSPETWDTHLLEILGHANGAMIASIVGDLPDGCSTAEPGTGYAEAAIATGGMLLSICEDEWSSYLEDFTTLVSQEPSGTFLLTYEPETDSLIVSVNGVASTSGWTYDAALNAVVFDEGQWPAGGDEIVLDYVALDYCD